MAQRHRPVKRRLGRCISFRS